MLYHRLDQSTLCTTAVGSERSDHGLIHYKWPEHWLASMAKLYSRCWRPFWSMVEHLLQVETCSGLVSQHYVPHWSRSESRYSWFMIWFSINGQTIDCLCGKTVFQVLRILLVYGRASRMGEKLSRWIQSALQHYVPLYRTWEVSIHGLIN